MPDPRRVHSDAHAQPPLGSGHVRDFEETVPGQLPRSAFGDEFQVKALTATTCRCRDLGARARPSPDALRR